jgi:hypothetical protein
VIGALVLLFAAQSGARVLPALTWSSLQGLPLLAGLLLAVVGVLCAWRWEAAGGVMALVGAAAIVLLVTIGSGMDMLLTALIFAAPLYVTGCLFLGCCWSSRRASRSDSA